MSVFEKLSAQELADLQSIVGPIAEDGKLTDAQMTLLQKDQLSMTLTEIARSPVGGQTMLQRLIDERHFLFNLDGRNPESDEAHFMRQYSMLSSQAFRIFFLDNDMEPLLAHMKENPLKSFAGPDVRRRLPSANTWIELKFPAGRRPMVPPVGEGLQTTQMRLSINRIAMHASANFMVHPFPTPEDAPEAAEIMAQPTFLKEANVMFFVEVDGHGIQTYAGLIQYGYGGAKVFKVTNALHAAYAMNGEPPTLTGHARMTNFTQFSCGMLAHVLGYFAVTGNYGFEGLRAYHRFEGQTGFTDDVMPDMGDGDAAG